MFVYKKHNLSKQDLFFYLIFAVTKICVAMRLAEDRTRMGGIFIGISKIHGPRPPRASWFFITTSGVTTSWYLFQKVEKAASFCCENNYDLWKELQPLTIFAKRFIVDVWQDSEYALDLNMPAFWIYQGSEYARVVNMLLVLKMSGF